MLRREVLLLVAGVLSSLVYAAADLVCGLRYGGYSFRDQVISELSAIGAPTAVLWGAMLSVYAVLFAAFTLGVLRAAGLVEPVGGRIAAADIEAVA